jgi:hypothetical protein
MLETLARSDPQWIFRTYAGHSSARASTSLARIGIRRVFTPRDYKLTDIVGALIDLCAGA